MTRSKANSMKQRGVDFKKIRRKVGRKLPPPKNTTNTEIKSKAIVLPEQSVAAEKGGLPVNKKGLTLKELLQQTSHHNAKVRRAELMLPKYAAVEKFRERIIDDDKVVRKSLYDLLKLVIFPGCKEGTQQQIISLLMAYIFHATTHIAVDVRIMAFNFLSLVIEFHPPSFSSYAEKIFQNYEDILKNNQYYLQDKGKLKDFLDGLVRCLMLLPWNKGETGLHNKDDRGLRVPHAYEDDKSMSCNNDFSHIIQKLKNLVSLLINVFTEFIRSVNALASPEGKSFGCLASILHSIDLIVRSFVYWTRRKKSKFPIFQAEPDVVVWDDTISFVFLKKLNPLFPLNPVHHLSEKDCDRLLDLNMVIAKIFFELNEWICLHPDLMKKFLEFIENALLGKLCRAKQSGTAVWEKHLVQLLPFIPNFLFLGATYWTSHHSSKKNKNWPSCLLKAFTHTFRESKPDSSLKLACVSAIEDMLNHYISASLKVANTHSLESTENSEFVDALLAWTRELPLLLIQLRDNHPVCSKAVLHLLLHIGQNAPVHPSLVCTYDNLQSSLLEFYSTCREGGHICCGPFLRLPRESQELSLCCVSYFSHLDWPLLKSMACCCLSPDLDPHALFWTIDVLDSAYKAGHIKVTDFLNVFVTLVLRFEVSPDVSFVGLKSDPRRQTLRSMTTRLCSYMVQMGNNSLVLQMTEEIIVQQIVLKPFLDNNCSLLRMIVALDSDSDFESKPKPSRLSEQSITFLGHHLLEYLMDAIQCVPEDGDKERTSSSILLYYLEPCFLLFGRCHKLMSLVLKTMRSAITETSLTPISDNCTQHTSNCLIKVDVVASVLIAMHKDKKLRKIMVEVKEDIDYIIQEIHLLQSSRDSNMTIEERHKLHCTCEQLKILK
ncbi:uncharacterized protein LOC133284896 [Gastrolobium bilobum]|uniref:uncharacterized protein LOC133284896 n=1 Tax=Gastrolobium bilobum TaxID=150636 RepID=UPI002AB2365E|nr:uncharacterized protein LOC133284896 [Gastrolobium bilobum]